jgi:hypothetical protein
MVRTCLPTCVPLNQLLRHTACLHRPGNARLLMRDLRDPAESLACAEPKPCEADRQPPGRMRSYVILLTLRSRLSLTPCLWREWKLVGRVDLAVVSHKVLFAIGSTQ